MKPLCDAVCTNVPGGGENTILESFYLVLKKYAKTKRKKEMSVHFPTERYNTNNRQNNVKKQSLSFVPSNYNRRYNQEQYNH